MAIGTAADIGIRVFLDDAASGGLLKINNLMRGVGDAARGSSADVGAMIGKMAGVGALVGSIAAFAAFVAAIKYSVDAANELQQAMFSVAVATHVPMAVAMQYTNQLMNLAAGSIYSSKEIADGIALLGRSGYSIQDIFSTMATAGVALGIATRTTAVEGFQLLAQTMAAYSAPASEAMHYADLLQFAFEHQTGSVSTLAAALSQVTPIAALMNTPLREIVAALDVAGPAMKSTATAGTALRYAISGVLQPTIPAIAAMAALGLITVSSTTPAMQHFAEQLLATGQVSAAFVKQNDSSVKGLQNLFAAGQAAGVIPLDAKFNEWAQASGLMRSAFFDAQGNAKDLTSILQILSDRMRGMPEAEKLAYLKDIFSVRGGQGIDVLLQKFSAYLAYLNQLKQSHDNAGGAMQRWQEIMGTLAGALAGLGSSLRDLGAVVGMVLLPTITAAATGLNYFVSWVRNLVNASPQAAAAFMAVGLAVSAFGIVASIAALAIMGIATPFLIFGGVALATVAVIAGLTIGITLLISHWNQVTAAVAQAQGAFRGVALALLLVGAAVATVPITSLVSAFLLAIPAAVAFTMTLVTQTIPAAIRFAIVLITQAVPAFFGFMLAVLGSIPAILAYAGSLLLAAAAEVAVALPFILLGALIAGMIVGLVLLIQHLGGMNLIISTARMIWMNLVATFQQVAAIIRSALLSALQQLQPVWQQLVQAFNQAQPALLVLGKILGGVLVVAIAILVGILRGLINVFVAVVVAIIGVAAGIIQAFMGVIQFFLGFFTALHGLVTGNTTEIQAGFRQMGQGILNIITGLWNAVKAVFVGAFNVIVGFVQGFVQGIVGFFHWLSAILVGHSIIPDMLNAIRNAFMSVLNAVASFVLSVLSRIGAFFSAAGSLIHSIVTNAMNAVRSAFQNGMNAAASLVLNGMNNVRNTIVSVGNIIISSAHSAWNGFVSAVQGGIGRAVSLVAGLRSTLGGILAGIAGAAISWGANIINAIANGIRGAIGAVTGAIGWVAGVISQHMPHSPAKLGPLRDLPMQSEMIGKQIAEGIDRSTPNISSALNRALGGVSSAPAFSRTGTPMMVGGGGGGANITVPLVVDGRVLGQVVLNYINGQMQMNGLGRSFR